MFEQIFEYVKTWIRHNQAMTISIILALFFSVWFIGCQSTTSSLLDVEHKVTEGQLAIEYSTELRRLESEMQTLKDQTEYRLQDLHRQDIFKQALFENAVLIAEGKNPNPLGLLSLLGTIFGIGAIIDNRKKDGLIKGLTTKSE